MSGNQSGNQFQALLDELTGTQETMAKAMDCGDDKDGDKKIKDAADDKGDGGGQDTVTGGTGNDTVTGGGAEEEPFGKSFIAIVDGKEVEAIDGTAMMKALWASNQELKATNTQLGGKVETLSQENATLAKALEITTGLLKSVHGVFTQQGDMIKALRTDVDRIGGQGGGRRTTVNVHEKPVGGGALAKAEGISGQELMAKSLTAQREGRITSLEVASIENRLGKGQPVPEELVARVLG